MTIPPDLAQRLPAPARAAGKRTMRAWGMLTASQRCLPSFLVIGTKRGGTTSMWNYLLDHPLVLPMFPQAQKIKSPHYFYWHYGRGERWYRSHYATRRQWDAASAQHHGSAAVGEASPYYLYDPRVPERVKALLPTVKLVVMLRDPVRRAYSHYWERVHEGVEPLSFEAALAAEPGRLAGEVERMLAEPGYYSRAHDYYSYRDRGVYQPQLEGWYAHFPSEQVLIVRSEDFYADQQATYETVTDFLGLPRHTLHRPPHFNYRPAEAMAEATREELVSYYRPYNERLYDYLGRDFGWAA